MQRFARLRLSFSPMSASSTSPCWPPSLTILSMISDCALKRPQPLSHFACVIGVTRTDGTVISEACESSFLRHVTLLYNTSHSTL